jgi:hypothetical protein
MITINGVTINPGKSYDDDKELRFSDPISVEDHRRAFKWLGCRLPLRFIMLFGYSKKRFIRR